MVSGRKSDRNPSVNMSKFERKERDPDYDLSKLSNQRVRVRFQGGREVDGILKGYDKLDNLVLDECVEYLRGKDLYCIYKSLKR